MIALVLMASKLGNLLLTIATYPATLGAAKEVPTLPNSLLLAKVPFILISP
jgi:hypothetical protein